MKDGNGSAEDDEELTSTQGTFLLSFYNIEVYEINKHTVEVKYFEMWPNFRI